MPGAIIDAVIIVVTTLFTTLFLLFISGQLHDTTAGNISSRAAAPVVSFAPTPTPAKHPSPTASPTPSPASATPTPLSTTTEVPNDAAMQTEIKKRLAADPALAPLGISISVTSGKVTLTGTAPTDDLKDRVEKIAGAVKGIKNVDNQIVVVGGLVRTGSGRDRVVIAVRSAV